MIAARLSYQNNRVPDAPSALPAFLKKELPRIVRAGPHISIQTKATNYLLSGADEIVLMDTTLGALDASLPTASENLNFLVTVKNIGANTLTIVGTVDGSAGITLAQWEAVTVACDGSAFYKVGAAP